MILLGGDPLLIVFIRTIVLYFLVLFTIRIMGKSELSEMSPFQLVIIFMIADLAAIPIESTSVSLINGVIAVFSLMFLQTLISTISLKCEWFKNLINGKPSILIEKGKINQKELRNLRISLNDLLEQLRIQNIYAPSDVEYAIMESNGELSVIPKAGKQPLTPDDLGLKKQEESLPLVIISDGVLYKSNLKEINLSESKLMKLLKRNKLDSYKEVFLAFTDSQHKFHIFISEKDKSKAKEINVCEIS